VSIRGRVSTWTASGALSPSGSAAGAPATACGSMRSKSDFLRARAAIARAVRAWFESQDYLEVETPTRVRNPGQELHLDAFPAGDDRFLITSPEHHMKRLVGQGHHRIFQLARCFRREENGPHHQPEFTMVEWYCAHAELSQMADVCEALVRVAFEAVGGTPPAVAERTTVRQLLKKHTGVDLRGDETKERLVELFRGAGLLQAQSLWEGREELGWDDVFFQMFLDRVEPHLGKNHPTFVFDWPLPLAALARRHPANPCVAERFELYAGGLELANAFAELVDPDEQRKRFVAELGERRARGKVVYPLDEDLLNTLTTMPETSGVALGFDRLVMLATGADNIADVVTFPAPVA